MISAEERKRRQRKNILEMYRMNFAKPFWDAYKNDKNFELKKLANISHSFKLGVCMAAPHGRYCEAFNKIDTEFMKEIKEHDKGHGEGAGNYSADGEGT